MGNLANNRSFLSDKSGEELIKVIDFDSAIVLIILVLLKSLPSFINLVREIIFDAAKMNFLGIVSNFSYKTYVRLLSKNSIDLA